MLQDISLFLRFVHTSKVLNLLTCRKHALWAAVTLLSNPYVDLVI
jgi:hypothetical protein